MIDSLPLFHRLAGQQVIVLGEGEAAEAKRRLVQRAGGVAVDDPQARGPRLAFVAMEDAGKARAMADMLRARGLLVNVVDQPALCDFITPSVIDRSPVLIAVGTGGASAGLAKHLRLRLEALLPQGLGALARGLHTAREALRARFPDAGDRRRALDAALGQGGMLDPLAEHGADRLADWLAGKAEGVAGGVVEIRLRTNDPEDLTLREARLLGSADTLAHERGVAGAVLDRARADAARVLLAPDEAPPQAQGLTLVLRAPG